MHNKRTCMYACALLCTENKNSVTSFHSPSLSLSLNFTHILFYGFHSCVHQKENGPIPFFSTFAVNPVDKNSFFSRKSSICFFIVMNGTRPKQNKTKKGKIWFSPKVEYKCIGDEKKKHGQHNLKI